MPQSAYDETSGNFASLMDNLWLAKRDSPSSGDENRSSFAVHRLLCARTTHKLSGHQ